MTYKKILKKDRIKFETLIREMLKHRFGIECEQSCTGSWEPVKGTAIVQTPYGPLEIRHFDGQGSIYTLCTGFEDPSKLPGKQVPYEFARPDTHQTHSLGGSIAGYSFNSYSGKWNFHFGSEWGPDGAAQKIDQAFETMLKAEVTQ
jgi:hypothetical protein